MFLLFQFCIVRSLFIRTCLLGIAAATFIISNIRIKIEKKNEEKNEEKTLDHAEQAQLKKLSQKEGGKMQLKSKQSDN